MFNLSIYFERNFNSEYKKGRKASKIVEEFAMFKGIDKALVDEISLGTQLYKVGYIGLPKPLVERLKNNQMLTNKEILEYRKYPEKGVEILAGKYKQEYDNNTVIGIIREHTERYDGCGYPSGLAGEAILETTYIASICINFVEKISQGKNIWKIAEELELDNGLVPEEIKKDFIVFLLQKSEKIDQILNA